jgi:pimeloyl-ACP methyl ester carboxylesterase
MHGLTANHNLFSNQVNYFEKDYNVIALDAPAHGESRPFTDFTYEKAAFAAKNILESNDINKAIFVGQSLGGYIAQSVLKRFPEIVSAFISIDSTPFGEGYYSRSDKWWLRQIE